MTKQPHLIEDHTVNAGTQRCSAQQQPNCTLRNTRKTDAFLEGLWLLELLHMARVQGQRRGPPVFTEGQSAQRKDPITLFAANN